MAPLGLGTSEKGRAFDNASSSATNAVAALLVTPLRTAGAVESEGKRTAGARIMADTLNEAVVALSAFLVFY